MKMRYIINGRIMLPDGEISGKALAFDSRIRGVVDEKEAEGDGIFDAQGGIVSPGLTDIHIHGFKGNDASDGDFSGLMKMSEDLIQNGVTSFLPTTMTLSEKELEKAFDCARKIRGKEKGASVLGVNAEGPFIAYGRKGAQNGEYIRPVDADFLVRHSDIIRLTTVAPETQGACEAIKKVGKASGIVFSMGHSDATGDEAQKGIEAGITHATHLFNAMSPLGHRNIGVAGAALTDGRVYCELIADTFHVSPRLYKMLYTVKKDRLVLITDCMRAGGMPDGEYTLGGQKVFLKGIECRLEDGTIAGSVLTLNKALFNFKKHTGLSYHEVINLASKAPCESIGEKERGTLEKGRIADITVFDNDFNVRKVFVSGVEKL